MAGRPFGGYPPQMTGYAETPPQVKDSPDDLEALMADNENDATDDNLSAADTPYSGGPDKEAALGGPADPMQAPRMRQGTPEQVQTTEEAQEEAEEQAEAEKPQTDLQQAAAEAREEAESEGEATEGEQSEEDQLRAEYEAMNLDDLKADAKSREMSGYSQLNKAELIDALVEHDQAQ